MAGARQGNQMMSAVANDIFDQLSDDLVSHGWLVQCVGQLYASNAIHLHLTGILEELLMSEKVEIGETRLVGSDYIEFIAWKGHVSQRISRANEAVEHASGPEKAFAYWLCLRQNVDRFEETTSKDAAS